jgi:ubiquinone/menaquinone biosynthesis C-methylase UbiE
LVLLLKNNIRFSNKKKRIIEDYNSSARFYDKRYSIIQKAKYDKILRNCFIKRKRILDAGCGTGLLFEYIIKSGVPKNLFKNYYVAVDISLEMLAEFKSKLLNLTKITKISLILSDIENLPFREDSFNLIFSITSFQNLSSHKKGFQEICRVSSKGGELKISILKKKLVLDELNNLLDLYLEDFEVINEELLEDIIIHGTILKLKNR